MLGDLKNAISAQVYGRNKEIDHLIALTYAALMLPRSQPVATLLAQPGSGRRHLIASLAQGLERPFVALDLSEITQESLSAHLGKVASDAVLLLQNPHKAPLPVQHELLGRLQSEVFDRTLIFFSATLGERFYLDGDFLAQFYRQPIWAGGVVMEHLAKSDGASSALISYLALGGLVLIEPATLELLFEIATHALEQMPGAFEDQSGQQLILKHPQLLAQALTLALAPWLNAKRIKAQLPRLLLAELTPFLGTEISRIEVRVGPKARRTLGGLSADLPTLGWRLSRDLDRLTLEWQKRKSDDRLTMSLSELTLSANTQEQSDSDTLPLFRFTRGFETIFGQRVAKEHLLEMTGLLKNPKPLERFGAPVPKGLLLYGPQGVGKSSLAQAFCAHLARPCFLVSTTELFDEDRIALVYEQAARHAPAIVWLKDIDAKGVTHGVITAVPSERLGRLIAQSPAQVFTLATAQELDEVPEPLLDPGRLDWSVEILELDYEARKAFMQELLKRPTAQEVSAHTLARYAGGMNANELARFERRALLEAARRNLTHLDEPFLIEQINTVKYGHKLEGTRLKNYKQELETTAYHEAAHAVISTLLQPERVIEQVTAAPRSGALGFVAYEIDEKISSLSRVEVQAVLAVLMAGRLAQIKAFGPGRIDSGAADDLERATALAWAAVSTLGLDEELGFMSIAPLVEALATVPFMGRIEVRVQHWLEGAQARADTLIDEHWASITALAEALIESETLEGEALAQIIAPLKGAMVESFPTGTLQ